MIVTSNTPPLTPEPLKIKRLPKTITHHHRHIYETTESTPAQKIAIFAAITFALVLIGITGNFVYEFIQTFQTKLNHALFYGLAFLGVLVLIMATYAAFFVLAMLTLHYQAKRQTLKTAQSNNDLFSATSKQIKAGAVYLSEQRTEQGIIKFKSLPKHSQKQPKPVNEITQPLALPLPEIKNSVLDAIRDSQRLLILGGSGTGKTSLLLHIAEQRAKQGELVILDPDGKINKWGKYPAIGQGDNYEQIKNELIKLNGIFKQRSIEYSQGITEEREFPIITVIADEWHMISNEIAEITPLIKPIMTRGRKYCIDLIISGNGETVKNLGMEGEKDLIKNFEAILRLSKIKNERIINANFGDGEIVYQHCGVFNQSIAVNYSPVISNDFQTKMDSILNNPVIKDDLILEQKIIDKYQQLINSNSFSLTKLAKEIYGNSNGRYIAQIKQVLSSRGIATT